MKKIWVKPQIETDYAITPVEDVNLLFEEWAELVYNHWCQLSEMKSAVSETLLTGRTGTDG
jgi:hypothetical protein